MQLLRLIAADYIPLLQVVAPAVDPKATSGGETSQTKPTTKKKSSKKGKGKGGGEGSGAVVVRRRGSSKLDAGLEEETLDQDTASYRMAVENVARSKVPKECQCFAFHFEFRFWFLRSTGCSLTTGM